MHHFDNVWRFGNETILLNVLWCFAHKILLMLRVFSNLEEKRPIAYSIGRFLLALAEGLEHSSLLLTLSKNSVKNSALRGANKALIAR